MRGFAIVLMVFYHFVWDLNFFGLYQGNVLGTAWQTFARSIATTFLFVVGVSLTLSYNSYRQKKGQPPPFSKYLWRGGIVFGFGLFITVATYFFIGRRGFVIFGILHLIGTAIILGYPFLRLSRWVSLVAGLAGIALGSYFSGLLVDYPWLIWLGIKQHGIFMVDYYPLLPWFAISLLGIFAGYSLYPNSIRAIELPNLSEVNWVRGLSFLGRHSLLIYLVHQPILIGLVFVATSLIN